MNDMIGCLKKFGLSEKESKAYLAALELGEGTASDISLKSRLPRTLTYDILERLIDLGIVGHTIKENKKYFNAVNPGELIRILKDKEETIKKIMPFLIELYKMKGVKRPKVEIYEGIEGMKSVMNDILRSEVKEFYAYGSSRSSYEVMPAFMDDWHKRRARQKVLMKVIYNNTDEARDKVKKAKESLKHAEWRFMPIELDSPTATLFYGDYVVFQSWTKEPFAVVIESKEMTENQKRYFGELWKIAKK